MTRAEYIAFFDVDGTILNSRSLLSFLEYYRLQRGLDGQTWFADYCTELRALLAGKVAREQLNAFYYTVFRGEREDALERLGVSWFAEASGRPAFFNEEMLREVQSHQAQGAEVVLVTGSFAAIMEPLARSLSCDAVLCTRLEVVDGVCTGDLAGPPCIGDGKVAQVRRLAGRRGVPLEQCVAYGDDETDAAMLALVGTGHLVESSATYRDELATWNRATSRPRSEAVLP